MDTAVKVPLSERINFRIIAFGLIFLTLIGVPAYWFFEEMITGGIIDRGDYKEVNLQAMSLFIGLLAFPNSLPLQDAVKLGVVVGSALSAVAGAVLLAIPRKSERHGK